LDKGIVYYTDNYCEERIAYLARKLLKKTGLDIVSVSHYPIDFGKNIVVDFPRKTISIFRQILIGLENSSADAVFLCEHDVLYHPSHFDIEPKPGAFYYDQNRCALNKAGQAECRWAMAPSFLCACRETLINHYARFVGIVSKGFSRRRHGFAPGSRRIAGMPTFKIKLYTARFPSIDIRRGNNYTVSNDFMGRGVVADEITGWGRTQGRFDDFLMEVDRCS